MRFSCGISQATEAIVTPISQCLAGRGFSILFRRPAKLDGLQLL